MISISKLDKNHHRRQNFDCGNDILNRYIKQIASQATKRNEAVIYVAHIDGLVVGFYTLSTDNIRQIYDPINLKNQSPHNPIPCALIGRLAVDVNYQGMGIAKDLLAHALAIVEKLSQAIGIAYVVVDAKDEKAQAFYEKYGFFELQNKPKRLCYPVSKLQSIK